MRWVVLSVVGIFVIAGIAGAASNSNKKQSTDRASSSGATTPNSAAATTAPAPTAPAPTAPAPTAPAPTTPPPTAPAPTTPPPTTPSLTLSQQNAIKSAQDYLSMGEGFSRLGLIQQLSSQSGEGYSLADATFAVDSLNVDWNAQAALSAKNYLQNEPFSCSGLIEQLSSPSGEQFTLAQAQYGAKAAGIC